MRTFAHRPILDLEVVGGRLYARGYLGLFKKADDAKRKDVTADAEGRITVRSELMNLGNPFKALLWCEDYLSSTEHSQGGIAPDPVVRSFLVPLTDADWLLSGGGRPLDQDRGSGQFGNFGDPEVYAKNMHPLAGSLVSFFLNVGELKQKEANQTKLPLPLLQKFLTGEAGDPREMAPSGLAAQHGRKGHQAEFAEKYSAAMTAYYESLKGTGFTDATQDKGGVTTSKYKKTLVDVLSIDLSKYPHVIAEAKRHPPEEKEAKKEKGQ
jgi:hypothetical protein